MRCIEWDDASCPAKTGSGFDAPAVTRCLDLTELHGEREAIRHCAPVEIDGRPALVMRTMNANRLRAVDAETGETVWSTPDLAPVGREAPQVSQLGVGDIDGDGRPEAVIASYAGGLFCVDALSGVVQWRKELPGHLNNPRLDIKKALPGPGAHVALVIGEDFDWCAPEERPRINFVRNPTLVVVDGSGEFVAAVHEYSAHNGCGHDVWMFDIDEDGLCEIFCSGDRAIHVFRGTGEKLFTLPCTGEGPGNSDTHADDLKAVNIRPDAPGREILYLDGYDGVTVASSTGEILERKTFPPEIASHLQLITPVETADGTRIFAQNIRSADSKLLCLDTNLDILWAAHAAADMVGGVCLDWDGDGEDELVFGSHGKNMFNKDGAEHVELYVMKVDGTPLYRHRWEGDVIGGPPAVLRTPAGEPDRLVFSVTSHNGPEGRFSLADGAHMRLCVMAAPETR